MTGVLPRPGAALPADEPARTLADLLRRSPAVVEAASWERLQEVLDAARAVPFYRDRAGAPLPARADATALAALPEVTADDLRADHRRLLHPEPAGQALADATGGTVGPPTPFFNSRRQRAVSEAMERISAAWVAGMDRPAVLVLDPDPMCPPAPKPRLLDRWRRPAAVARAPCHGPEGVTFDRAWRVIAERRPHVLVGTRSALIGLAARGRAEPTLRAAVSFGEPLHTRHRSHLAEALGVPVTDRYGLREVGLVAAECGRKRLHVLTPAVRVEIVSDAGVNAIGELGRLVVTPLHNTAAPLLRLDTGDQAVWKGLRACDCGLPLPVMALPAFPRRLGSVIELPDGRGVNLRFFEHRLAEAPDVVQWQLLRSGPARLRLRLQPRDVAEDPMPAALRAELERAVRDFLGRDVAFSIEVTRRLDRSRSGRVEALVNDAP